MADITPDLKWVAPVNQSLHPSSDDNKETNLEIVARQNLGLVQVFSKNGKQAAVEKKLSIKSTPGLVSVTKNLVALPVCPGQWVCISEDGANGSFGSKLSKQLDKIGYVSEQSQGRVCFRVSGKNVREFLERGCRLDLHPSVTSAGFCAQTQMAQIGVLIHQVDDAPTYDLYVYAGFAMDFAKWMLHTGMKYGVKFTADE